jgi:predicted nuclease of restriction endonuclease-like (RecB) superfamily
MTENKDYIKFLTDLKSKIRQAQYKAYRAVNTELITLYWEIGQSIAAKQEKLGWGQKIIQQLSEDLQNEFPKNSGFSYANLDRMRKFYLTYKANPKLAQLVREIPWEQNIVIIEKLNVAKYYLTRDLPAELLKQLSAPSVIENKLKELEEEEEK